MAPPIKIHKNIGAAPSIHHKFVADKVKTHFVERYRAYQWSQGFDIKVPDSLSVMADKVVLKCATSLTCPFHISATLQDFTTGAVAGQRGWGVDSNPFVSIHSHSAPYTPLILEQENARRAALPADHPSLSAPPLVPVQPQQTGDTFAEILQKVNPAYSEYQAVFTKLGFTPTTRLEELEGIDEAEIQSMFEEEVAIPHFVGMLVCKGLVQARKKLASGMEGENDETTLAETRAMDWVRLKIQEDREAS